MDYVNIIELKYRYSQIKSGSSIVSIEWLLNNLETNSGKIPENKITWMSKTALIDPDDILKGFMLERQYTLSETRTVMKHIFVSNKQILRKALEEGYRYMSLDVLLDSYGITFLEERSYRVYTRST